MPIRISRGDVAGRLLRLFRGQGSFPLLLDETVVPVVMVDDLRSEVETTPETDEGRIVIATATSNAVGSAGDHPRVALWANQGEAWAYENIAVSVDWPLSGSTEAVIQLGRNPNAAGFATGNEQAFRDLRIGDPGAPLDSPRVLGFDIGGGANVGSPIVGRWWMTSTADRLVLPLPPLIATEDNIWIISTVEPDEAILVTCTARRVRFP